MAAHVHRPVPDSSAVFTRNLRPARTTAIGLAISIGLIACAGCVTDSSAEFADSAPTKSAAQSPAPPPTPGLGDVDQTDPTAVSKAAVTIMWSYDARTDARTGQRSAYLRASGYLTPTYRAHVATSMPATPLPAELLAHHARSRTVLAPAPHDDAEPDTVQAASRTWRVTVTPIGRDGWCGRPVTVHVYVALIRPGPLRPWRISHTTTY
ncbi:hypothetical protein [Spirillospora sp. CA-128828]|uniref:hypothetical protein n=1 Tax=Spirillospora sp. CA-128828 TaxID=3240033 RepID=UPI003D8DBE7D